MKKEFTFYKSEKKKWYIDLPDYIEAGGNVEELEMVEGADIFLDIISNYGSKVIALINTKEVWLENELNKSALQDCSSGCYYEVKTPKMDIWLCDVTKYIFGNFPDKIYFQIIQTFK